MRVITGTARGRVLKELEGLETRPTTGKVKESLFSIIQFDIEGRRVLDLFAGTGQLGIEALSRGAAECVFIDRRADAVKRLSRLVLQLKAYCREKLLAMGGVVPVGEGMAPHILAVSLVGYPSANIVTDLGAQGICISAGSACHQGKASHVVSALGLDKKTAAGVIRISFSPDNTREDVDVLCQALLAHRDSRFPML